MAETSMPTSSPGRLRVGVAVLIFLGIPTFVTLLVATLWHVRFLHLGRETHFWTWFLGESFDWYIWSLFAPLIFWLGRVVQIRRDTLVWSLPIHFAAASVLAIVQNSVGVLGSMWVHHEVHSTAEKLDMVNREVVWMGPWSIFIYFAILAAYLALTYYRRFHERQLAASRLETELTKAQLDALHAQLQPHFLFNTLNSISVLMRKEQLDEAQGMLGRLGELLRYVLAKGNCQEVPLETELGFVQGYLDIERTRFGDRLRAEVTVDDNTLAARVPSFLLQNLVENAVRHGLATRLGTGDIRIRASRDANRLLISVEDNGVGLSRGTGHPDGVGLRNARSRLEYLYGPDHRFELTSPPDGGTLARLEIPYRE